MRTATTAARPLGAVTVMPSPIEGSGLLAARPISVGEVVTRIGGRLVSNAELTDLFANTTGYVDSVSLYSDANVVVPPGTSNHAGNHSCVPNTWWLDPFSTVARREIARGEEVTIDHASITDDDEFAMECHCGADACRGVVTGVDWRNTDLQLSYGEHWVPVLRDRNAGRSTR